MFRRPPQSTYQPRNRNQQQGYGKGKEGAISTDIRNEQKHGQKGSHDTAGGRDGVELPGGPPRLAHLLDTQANGEWRDAAQQDHRNGKEQDHRDQRTVEDTDRIRRKSTLRPEQDRPRKERDHADQKRCDDRQCIEYAWAWTAVCQSPSDIVSNGEIEQDQADQISPDEERASKIRGQQTRRRKLHGQRARARHKNDQDEQPALQAAAGRGGDSTLLGLCLTRAGGSGRHRKLSFYTGGKYIVVEAGERSARSVGA